MVCLYTSIEKMYKLWELWTTKQHNKTKLEKMFNILVEEIFFLFYEGGHMVTLLNVCAKYAPLTENLSAVATELSNKINVFHGETGKFVMWFSIFP